MHWQTGTPEISSAPAQGLPDLGLQPAPLSELNRLVRSVLAPGPVPRSAPCLPLGQEEAELLAAEIDRWELIEHCYREHMARCALEEMYAAGEMAPFGD